MSGNSGGDGNGLNYAKANAAVEQTDPAALAPYLFWLMFRNVASDGLVFNDPVHPGIVSAPGCVLASPSWENTATQVTQDYVYHWTRDAAIVALELSAAYTAGTLPTNQPLIDYVTFSATCQASPGDFDRASFYINGAQRPWTDQTDGPALQTVALLALYRQLDAPTQAIATGLINANLAFLSTAYQGQTLQPVGRGVRLLLLRPLGPAPLLPGGRRQRRRHRGPELAPGRADLARERARRALERPVLPVDAAGPDRLPRPLRPQHRHRPGGDLRGRVGHRPPAAGDRGAAARPVGRLRRRRTSTRSTAPTRPRASARCSAATRATSTTATPTPWSATIRGRSPPPTSPSSTTVWQSKSFHPERSRPTLSPPRSSPRSA